MKTLLVHLIRGQNGPTPVRRFLESYVAHPAGAEHELVLALKGFPSEQDAFRCLAAARGHGLDPDHMILPDDGLDLTAYARAVSRRPADRYCFVNSFSRILADDWLGHLGRALDAPGVQLAGATGSWASHQDYRRYHLGLHSGYDEVFDDREQTRLGFLALTRQHNPGKRDLGRLPFKLAAAADMIRDRRAFEPFPSAHLRTNAFIASARLMIALRFPQIRTKQAAYRLEGGTTGLTRRVIDGGGRVVVVDRHGALYDVNAWDRSHTFWAGAQQNLLVADNQTDDYAQAGDAGRRLLTALAWGRGRRRPTES